MLCPGVQESGPGRGRIRGLSAALSETSLVALQASIWAAHHSLCSLQAGCLVLRQPIPVPASSGLSLLGPAHRCSLDICSTPSLTPRQALALLHAPCTTAPTPNPKP